MSSLGELNSPINSTDSINLMNPKFGIVKEMVERG